MRPPHVDWPTPVVLLAGTLLARRARDQGEAPRRAEEDAPAPSQPAAQRPPLAGAQTPRDHDNPEGDTSMAHEDKSRHDDDEREKRNESTADEDNPKPTQIPGPGRMAVLKRTWTEFREDNLTDWAAALTYYAVLSLFPMLIVLVALVGIFGQYPQTTNTLVDIARQVSGSDSALGGLQDTINGVVQSKGGAGALLGFGLLGALWSASGYIGAFMRASNAIYEVPEGRPMWKLRPLQVVVTLTMVMLLALVLVALVVSGPVAEAIGDVVGLGSTAVTVYQLAKWPIMALVVITMLALLYYIAPNVKLPKFKWITPGSVVALVVWILASVVFAFYVANFGSYNKTYGSLGGAISLLVWMWITNIAVLFGQELNAEIERGRELAAGKPAEREMQLPLRDEPKKDLEEEGAKISAEARREMQEQRADEQDDQRFEREDDRTANR